MPEPVTDSLLPDSRQNQPAEKPMLKIPTALRSRPGKDRLSGKKDQTDDFVIPACFRRGSNSLRCRFPLTIRGNDRKIKWVPKIKEHR